MLVTKKFLLFSYLVFTISTLFSSNLFASLVNPCGDDTEGVEIESVWEYRPLEFAPNYSCYYPKEIHCVKEKLCPRFSMPHPDVCKNRLGPNAELVMKWNLKKINDKYSCRFPEIHCIDNNMCPMYELVDGIKYCQEKAPGSLPVWGEQLVRMGDTHSCYKPTINCVDSSKCKVY